jgi:fluoride exporter
LETGNHFRGTGSGGKAGNRFLGDTSFDVFSRQRAGLRIDSTVPRGMSEVTEAYLSSENMPTALQTSVPRRPTLGAALAVVMAVTAAFAGMGIYFWIAIGSALGGMARYWLSGVAARLMGETFPWGTLLINIGGSFVIGFFGTLTGPDGRIFVGSTARQFVMVGICGGFTTFSSFSLQTLNLLNDGEWVRAGGYTGASVALCLVGVWAGYALAVGLNNLNFL